MHAVLVFLSQEAGRDFSSRIPRVPDLSQPFLCCRHCQRASYPRVTGR